MIDPDKCQGCGICAQVCRFNAVHLSPGEWGEVYAIDPIACDGCAACVYQCPEEAIRTGTAQIEAYCREHDVEVAGRIPFDAAVTEAMVQGEPVTAFDPEAPASHALRQIWQRG